MLNVDYNWNRKNFKSLLNYIILKEWMDCAVIHDFLPFSPWKVSQSVARGSLGPSSHSQSWQFLLSREVRWNNLKVCSLLKILWLKMELKMLCRNRHKYEILLIQHFWIGIRKLIENLIVLTLLIYIIINLLQCLKEISLPHTRMH